MVDCTKKYIDFFTIGQLICQKHIHTTFARQPTPNCIPGWVAWVTSTFVGMLLPQCFQDRDIGVELAPQVNLVAGAGGECGPRCGCFCNEPSKVNNKSSSLITLLVLAQGNGKYCALRPMGTNEAGRMVAIIHFTSMPVGWGTGM